MAWGSHGWMVIALGVAWLLTGLYRLRFADYYQQKEEERQLARGLSRFSFKSRTINERRSAWIDIAIGAAWIALGILP